MAENEDFLMDDSAHEAMAEGIIRALADKGAAIVRRDYSGAPSVGRVVHYVSFGTPGGEFPSVCRAAVITQVNADNPNFVGLAVLNPTGMFFQENICQSSNGKPGTWHWPERVDA